MKRPMLFFATGDCGCSNAQTGNATPVIPSSGALICDSRYFTLATAPKGQVVVVPKGANCQAFLSAAAGIRGFVFYSGGEVSIEPAPALTLPLLNPSVSGVYPQPASFKYLMAGTGEPADWRHVAAPTSGTFVLQCKNGSWILEDAASIPGIDQIGLSSATVVKGGMMMITEVSDNRFALRRLAVLHKRVVVGDIDEDTGFAGYKALPPGDYLEHPKAKFTELVFQTIASLDVNGNAVSGGLEQAVVTGAGAITDGTRMIYSPAAKRLFKAPAQTIQYTAVNTPSASTVPAVDYAAMPGGHGAGLSLNYNYSTVRVDFTISFTAAENFVLGLYRDGLLLKEFPNTATLDGFGFFYVDQSNPLGAHTYDVRWKKTSGTTAAVIVQSSMLITTLG